MPPSVRRETIPAVGQWSNFPGRAVKGASQVLTDFVVALPTIRRTGRDHISSSSLPLVSVTTLTTNTALRKAKKA